MARWSLRKEIPNPSVRWANVLGRRADPVVGRGAEDAKVTVMIVPQ